MPYIGNKPLAKYATLTRQTFSSPTGTSHTLSQTVTNSDDLLLYINNVKQNPADYTASGTTLTTASLAGGTEMYCLYYGKTTETVAVPASSVGDSHIVDMASSKLTGTIADARFPATLPASSGANLTSLPAGNLTGTLPALDGSSLTGVGGAWNMIGTSEASTSASLTVTGLDSTYDNYAIGISDMTPSSDIQNAYIRLGDSSGIDSGASDYAWHLMRNKSHSGSYAGQANNSTSSIQMGAVGTGTGEGMGGMLYLNRPANGTLYPVIHGTYTSYYVGTSTKIESGVITGVRLSGISVDRVQIFIGAGNIVTGRLTVWGISHT